MKTKHREYIILQIPSQDVTVYTRRAKELTELFEKSGIDTSNLIILPDDISVSCIDLPLKLENVEVQNDSSM